MTSILDRLERLAASRRGLLFIGAWGFAEAIVFPVVPDVALCLLCAAAPRQATRLFVAAIAGALLGSAILAFLAAVRPAEIMSALLAIPAIDDRLIGVAEEGFSRGDWSGWVGIGLTRPLKVDTFAWTVTGGAPLLVPLGVIVNRLTRIGPVWLIATIAGVAAPGFVRRHERPLLALYAAAWIGVYAIYWTRPPH